MDYDVLLASFKTALAEDRNQKERQERLENVPK